MQIEPVNIMQIAIASPAGLLGVGLTIRHRFRALGVLLLTFAVHMSINVLGDAGIWRFANVVTPALSLLYGPLFYFFIRGLVFKSGLLGLRDLVHLIPALVAIFIVEWLGVVRAATVISLITYGALGLVNIWRFHRATDAIRSDALSLRLNWIIAIFVGFEVLVALDVIRVLTVQFQPAGFQDLSYAISMLAVATLFGVLVYFAMNRPRYFSGLTDKEFRMAPRKSVAVVGPSPEDRAGFEQIEKIVLARGLFRQPHLTLFDLANETDLPERDISRLVNQLSGRNFCDFINAFRVKEAMRLLRDEESGSKTILTIAFEAGFASKSTFNAVFKTESGETPSVYRRHIVQTSE